MKSNREINDSSQLIRQNTTLIHQNSMLNTSISEDDTQEIPCLDPNSNAAWETSPEETPEATPETSPVASPRKSIQSSARFSVFDLPGRPQEGSPRRGPAAQVPSTYCRLCGLRGPCRHLSLVGRYSPNVSPPTSQPSSTTSLRPRVNPSLAHEALQERLGTGHWPPLGPSSPSASRPQSNDLNRPSGLSAGLATDGEFWLDAFLTTSKSRECVVSDPLDAGARVQCLALRRYPLGSIALPLPRGAEEQERHGLSLSERGNRGGSFVLERPVPWTARVS